MKKVLGRWLYLAVNGKEPSLVANVGIVVASILVVLF